MDSGEWITSTSGKNPYAIRIEKRKQSHGRRSKSKSTSETSFSPRNLTFPALCSKSSKLKQTKLKFFTGNNKCENNLKLSNSLSTVDQLEINRYQRDHNESGRQPFDMSYPYVHHLQKHDSGISVEFLEPNLSDENYEVDVYKGSEPTFECDPSNLECYTSTQIQHTSGEQSQIKGIFSNTNLSPVHVAKKNIFTENINSTGIQKHAWSKSNAFTNGDDIFACRLPSQDSNIMPEDITCFPKKDKDMQNLKRKSLNLYIDYHVNNVSINLKGIDNISKEKNDDSSSRKLPLETGANGKNEPSLNNLKLCRSLSDAFAESTNKSKKEKYSTESLEYCQDNDIVFGMNSSKARKYSRVLCETQSNNKSQDDSQTFTMEKVSHDKSEDYEYGANLELPFRNNAKSPLILDRKQETFNRENLEAFSPPFSEESNEDLFVNQSLNSDSEMDKLSLLPFPSPIKFVKHYQLS